MVVCTHHTEAPGNEKLLSKGGVPIDPESIPTEASFSDWIEQQIETADADFSTEIKESAQDPNPNRNDNTQVSLEDF